MFQDLCTDVLIIRFTSRIWAVHAASPAALAENVWFLDFTMVVAIPSNGRQTIWPDQPKDEPSESKGVETVCRPPDHLFLFRHFLNGGTRFQMLCMPTNEICPGRLFPSLWLIRGRREMQPRTPKPSRVHAWLGLQSVSCITPSPMHNEVGHKLQHKLHPDSIDMYQANYQILHSNTPPAIILPVGVSSSHLWDVLGFWSD